VSQERLRCAAASVAAGEDLIGWAVPYDQYVMVERPLPWPSDVTDGFPDSARVKEARDRGLRDARRKVRVLAVQRDRPIDGTTRVVHYRRPRGMSAAYERESFVVPDGAVSTLVIALLDKAVVELEREANPTGRELLVCTHGTVDACCATLGYPLYQKLTKTTRDVRVWRVSHFGYHRFAPTLIEMPGGLWWGRLDDVGLDVLLDRARAVESILPYYCGWGGAAMGAEQVAERAVLLEQGWSWLQTSRRVRRSGDCVVIESKDVRYEATVEPRGQDCVPFSCHELPRSVTQFAVRSLVRVDC
jgi:hypothetical protein